MFNDDVLLLTVFGGRGKPRSKSSLKRRS